MTPVALIIATLLAAMAIAAAAAMAVMWRDRTWDLAAQRMRRRLNQLAAVGERRHLELHEAGPLRSLGEALNSFVDSQERDIAAMKADVEAQQMQLGRVSMQLAALVSGLPQGVIVCGTDHRITLCNDRAASLLGSSAAVGESIFTSLGEEQVQLALDRVTHWRSEEEESVPTAQWVAHQDMRLLRVLLSPIVDSEGYVLSLEDVTRSIDWNSRRERLLRDLNEGMRGAVGNLRAAVETVHRYPDMEPDRRECFNEVIRTEVQHISLWLHEATRRADTSSAAAWPLDEMQARDIGDLVQRGIERRLRLPVGRAHQGDSAAAGVDGHGLCQAIVDLAARLAEHFTLPSLTVETGSSGRFVQLMLAWNGSPLDAELLRAWRHDAVERMLQRHDAELWSEFDRERAMGRLCLQLPAVVAAVAA